MDHRTQQSFERTKIVAQYEADFEDKPMSIIEADEAFVIIATEDLHDKVALYTACPSIYEELTSNARVYYNSNEIGFTNVRKILDDDNEEIEMESTTATWTIEYAKRVRDFLNKVL